ncbi:uncharacterized protein [Triticum aestivum]|uniref:uncharacterized protein n=1 Tax=Triticum aestivum TaxID=4565 RepID=UPI001D01AE4C|nr:uncharacterized protein LOC123060267 [Triticum aestivum]
MGKAAELVQWRMWAGSAVEGDLLVGAAGARRLRRFRYLTALVNVLGLIQQLSLGQDKNISWIQSIEIAEDSTKGLHLFYKFSISGCMMMIIHRAAYHLGKADANFS